MIQSKLTTLLASAAFALSIGVGSASALDLGHTVSGITGGVSGAVGGVAGGVSGAVGGVTGAPSGAVGGVTGEVSNTVGAVTSAPSNAVGGASGSGGGATVNIRAGSLLSANLSVLSEGGILRVNSRILKSQIKAKITALSTKDLLKVCVGIGGGGGCNTGSRSKLLGLIDTRLGVLSGKQLVSLCLNIGSSGCGIVGGGTGGGGGGPGGKGGGGKGGGGAILPAALAGMSDSEIAVRQRQCKSVLAQPVFYERNLVQLCELLRKL